MTSMNALLTDLAHYGVVFEIQPGGRVRYRAEKDIPISLRKAMRRFRKELLSLVQKGFVGLYPWWIGCGRTEPRRAFHRRQECVDSRGCRLKECLLYPIENNLCVERTRITF